ncbi:MAG: DedA family protein [Alphaproteobacteria bacterium]|nr:DedA family protein [Alphaproteobacteria bacterium]
MQEYLDTYGYLAILVLTFLEGETVVILAGIAAYQGYMDIYLVGVSGFAGSFLGDQFYFTIGRRYGVSLLNRWPQMSQKIEWAFKLVRRYETLYILSFRFVYGIRNISPFVIAISGVSRLKFLVLNACAAALWAASFSAGGYFFGHAMEKFLGEHQSTALMVLAGLLALVGLFALIRGQIRARRLRRAAEAEAAAPSE